MILVLLEIKAQVDAMWEQMNKGVSNKTLNKFTSKPNSTSKKTAKKSSSVSPCCCSLLQAFVKKVNSYGVLFLST